MLGVMVQTYPWIIWCLASIRNAMDYQFNQMGHVIMENAFKWSIEIPLSSDPK
jgi:hypothetical protein